MPDVAADDKGFMVVWHGLQGEETISRVFAARVAADGAAGAPAALTEGSSPRIAWNGKDHLVTCFDARRSANRRRTPAASPWPPARPTSAIRPWRETAPASCCASTRRWKTARAR